MQETWAETLDRASRGDADAQQSLLIPYLPQLRAYLRANAGPFVRAHESVSDLVQSTCRRLLSALPRMRVRTAHGFKKRVFDTARRLLVDKARYYRAEKRRVPRGTWDEPDEETLACYTTVITPGRRLVAKERLAQVERALQRLSERDRNVILWERLVGLSHTEIGRRLGVKAASVKMILYRALARLSQLLGSDE